MGLYPFVLYRAVPEPHSGLCPVGAPGSDLQPRGATDYLECAHRLQLQSRDGFRWEEAVERRQGGVNGPADSILENSAVLRDPGSREWMPCGQRARKLRAGWACGK